jgi:glucokinase-like ROK family protein
VLVADLGATSIAVAITDLGGRILGHYAEPADVANGPDQVLSRVEVLFSELHRTTGGAAGPVWGIGIGVPGPVEFASGRPISPPIMPGWDGYPIRDRFAARFGGPVWVDNDVNVLALGEWRSGIAQGHDNVVVVKIGTGIGAGIISDGRLHRGAQGSAGDVGHIQVIDDASVICRCGNVGCLEALAGGAALGRHGEAAALEGRSARLRAAYDEHGELSAEDVARAAAFGDPVAVDLLQAAGRRVGNMLASVVNFFNPSLIIIGGGVAQSGDQLLASIRETVYGRSLPLATRQLLIQRASLGLLGGVIGASALVVDQLFAREVIEQWLPAGRPTGMPEVASA